MAIKRMNVNDTAVAIGESDELSDEICEGFEQAAVCVIYDSNVEEIAKRVIADMKKVFRVFEFCMPSVRSGLTFKCEPPEYARHVIGIGAGSVAQRCKAVAAKLKVDWSLYLTAPSTDRIMCECPPKTVFIPSDVVINCPFCCLASGYGILFSEQLRAFDGFFASKVLALDDGDTSAPAIEANDATELAAALLKISADKKRADSAELMAQLLYFMALKSGKRPRLMGEYKFLASSLLCAFYTAYLGAPSIDCMPPDCLDSALDVLSYLGVKEFISPKKVDFFDANAYFRISYILSEYRMDLLERLASGNQRAQQRFWRRLYPDAGYWLKSELSVSEMLRAMSLAGAFSDSLLGYAFASGVTAKF